MKKNPSDEINFEESKNRNLWYLIHVKLHQIQGIKDREGQITTNIDEYFPRVDIGFLEDIMWLAKEALENKYEYLQSDIQDR